MGFFVPFTPKANLLGLLTMVNSISASLALPAANSNGNSIVLYQSPLPERYSLVVPFVEVAVEKWREGTFENQPRIEGLYYDRQGRLNSQNQKGLFINTFF
jgi:hypothetical protein